MKTQEFFAQKEGLKPSPEHGIISIGKATAHKVVSLRDDISLPDCQVQGRLIYFRLLFLSM